MKGPSFFFQSRVLISRYFHIVINDKKNLLLKILIPLLTIIIVCVVACGDMFSIMPDEEHSVNEGLPVLSWETVVQEKKPDKNSDSDENELIEPDEVTVSVWNGSSVSMPSAATKLDGENYLLLTDADQFAFVAFSLNNGKEEYLTYNYLLQCDVDLDSHEFTPIGTKDFPFTGTFDGNGHTVSGLKIEREEDYTGLFGYVASDASASKKTEITNPQTGSTSEMIFCHNGTVKDLRLTDVSVSSKGQYTGAVVGCAAKKARVTSVCVKNGTVSGDDGSVGGIVGLAKGSDAEIYICYNNASVEAKKGKIGGLVGDLDESRLSAAYASCSVSSSGDDDDAGAVAGNCADPDEQLKNVVYNTDKTDELKAVGDEDYDGLAYGVEEEKLKDFASFLVPFKDIMSEYASLHLSEEDEERYDQDDYDPEEDEDLDDTYGFKRDGQLAVFGATQTGLFMLVCVAIFVGICNSIQEICKERNILKREYMTNLRLSSYVVSKLVVQAVICAVQMLAVILIFSLFVGGKQLPGHGVLFGGIWAEYFITMFLLAFAADTMSLFISALVKTSELANTFIPIILIVQIVFSGVLFEMNGVLKLFQKLMISKWGINALAAITCLNDSQPIFLIENPSLQLQLGSSLSTVSADYAGTASNLLFVWGILLIFIVVSSAACGIVLRRVKNDRR